MKNITLFLFFYLLIPPSTFALENQSDVVYDWTSTFSLYKACSTETFPDNSFRQKNQVLCAEADRRMKEGEEVEIVRALPCLNPQLRKNEDVCPKEYLFELDFPRPPYTEATAPTWYKNFASIFEEIKGESLVASGKSALPKAFRVKNYEPTTLAKHCRNPQSQFAVTDRILCTPYFSHLPLEDSRFFLPRVVADGSRIQMVPKKIDKVTKNYTVYYASGEKVVVGHNGTATWTDINRYIIRAVEAYKEKLKESKLNPSWGEIIVEDVKVYSYSDQTGSRRSWDEIERVNRPYGEARARSAAEMLSDALRAQGINISIHGIDYRYMGLGDYDCIDYNSWCDGREEHENGERVCYGNWRDNINHSCLDNSRRSELSFTLGFKFNGIDQPQLRQN